MNIKFDLNDITLVPAVFSEINSRSEISLEYFPLITAPMDLVVSNENVKKFLDLNFNVAFPRQEYLDPKYEDIVFKSYGLDEIESLINSKAVLNNKILIDVASAHTKRLYNISKRIKEEYDVELMIGNIGNPKTFLEYSKINVDYTRISIGTGSACLSSQQLSINYPIGSLIQECREIANEIGSKTKIIADGGFKSYADIIKALALGADFVMLGGILSKSFEACSDNYLRVDDYYGKIADNDLALQYFKEGKEIYKYYRGMSTKEVQAKWGKKNLRTAEGISKYNKVEYMLGSWVENFNDYLKSAMSYCNAKNLSEFIGKAEYVHITQEARNRFNK